jgi:hypothetical protein
MLAANSKAIPKPNPRIQNASVFNLESPFALYKQGSIGLRSRCPGTTALSFSNTIRRGKKETPARLTLMNNRRRSNTVSRVAFIRCVRLAAWSNLTVTGLETDEVQWLFSAAR